MSSFTETLLAKKQAILDSKSKGLSEVVLAKQNSKTATVDPYLVTPSTDVVNTSQRILNEQTALSTDSPVIESDGTVSKHTDGTFSVQTAEGKFLPNLTETDVRSFSGYNQENFRAQQAGAPDSFIGNRGNAIAQTFSRLGEQGAAAFVGDTTLQEQVSVHNDKVTAEGTIDAGIYKISDRDVTQYKSIQGKETLSVQDSVFKSSYKYSVLADLAKQASIKQSRFDAIQSFGKDVDAAFPVNRADQVAVQAAFKTIAKNKGISSAVWNAVTNDLGTLFEQGIDSTPYMIAFTVGGPITQAAILGTLSVGKSRQAIEEFKKANGREPTANEIERIKLWSTVSTVAEKYGDLAVTKAIPISRISRINKIQKDVFNSLPEAIAKTAVLRPAVALSGEGASGAITATAEQLAQSGEVTDVDQIAYDAVAEAFGTPGGVAGMVTAKAALNVVTGQSSSTSSTPVAPEAAPLVTPTPQAPAATGDFDTDIANVNTEGTLTPESYVAASDAIKGIDTSKLTPEQQTRFVAKVTELKSKNPGENAVEETVTMNSLPEFFEQTVAQQQEQYEALEDKTTPEAKTTAKAIQVSEARNKLVGSNIAQVSADIKSGKTDRWKGIDTHLDELKNVEAGNDAARKLAVTNTNNKLQTHAQNMTAKNAAFQEAAAKPEVSGMSNVVYSTRVNPEDQNNRAMQYEQKTIPIEQYTTESKDPKIWVNSLHKGSSTLLNTVEAEAAYGEEVASLVTDLVASDTTITEQQQARIDAASNELDQAIVAASPKAKEVSDSDISAITNVPVAETAPISTPTTVSELEVALAAAKAKEAAEKSTQSTSEADSQAALDEQNAGRDERPEGDPSVPSVTSTPVQDPIASDDSVNVLTEEETKVAEKQVKKDIEASSDTGSTTTKVQKNFAEGVVLFKNKVWPKIGRAIRHKALNIEGKGFTDLIKISNTPGIQTLPDTAFLTEPSLTAAIIALGVPAASAATLSREFTSWAKEFSKVSKIPANNGAFVLKYPLNVLYRHGENDTTEQLPPQLVFASMLGMLNKLKRSPKNTHLLEDWQQTLFLWGQMEDANVSPEDLDHIAGIGPKDTEYANEVGTDIVSIAKMSAKNLEQDWYIEKLGPALGLLAMQTASQRTNPWINIVTHTFKFDQPYVTGRFHNNYRLDKDGKPGPVETYDHIQINVDEKTGSFDLTGLTTPITDGINVLAEGVDLGDGDIPAQEASTKAPTDIKGSIGGTTPELSDAIVDMQQQAWRGTNTVPLFVRLAEMARSKLNEFTKVELPDELEDHEIFCKV